jgi:putative folate metabolism gamma-glutamate ligase
MWISPIKTERINSSSKSLLEILDEYLPALQERSILAVTSKVVSVCEGRVVKKDSIDKEELIKKEAEYFIPSEKSAYGITLAIKENLLAPSAGIDESNGNGHFILWPKNPQKTTNELCEYLRRRFLLKEVGVIMTDSKSSPLRRGVTGVALAHSGFSALNDFGGSRDIFGQKKRAVINVMDALAAAAVLVMGETNEQTPLAVIQDLSFVYFQTDAPSEKELKRLYLQINNDLYAPLLKSARWQKGGKSTIA